MDIRVRQVYAPVFFLCFFFRAYSVLFQSSPFHLIVKAATKCPHLDQSLYFSSLATKFIEADHDDKKASTLRDGKLIDLAKLNSYDLFSRQKYH